MRAWRVIEPEGGESYKTQPQLTEDLVSINNKEGHGLCSFLWRHNDILKQGGIFKVDEKEIL